MCDGARFTKPALPISTHIRYRFGWRAGCYTAGSLPAVPRFWPIVVRHLLASLAHEGQQPLAQESLENRSHTHERTSSLPQALRSTVLSCSFLHPWARKHNACRQPQKRSSGRSIQARYGGENRRAYSAGAVSGTATCIQYALASRPSMAKWKFGPGVCFLEAGDSPDASGGLHACKCRVMEAWPAISPQRLHFPIDCCLLMAEQYYNAS